MRLTIRSASVWIACNWAVAVDWPYSGTKWEAALTSTASAGDLQRRRLADDFAAAS